jgi:hypothetical protein
MARLLAVSALVYAFTTVTAQPEVLSFPMHRNAAKHARAMDRSRTKVKRDPFSVNLDGFINGGGFYAVNITVGTPAQNIVLDIDTGSSDVWMFGPNSCDTSTSLCAGGFFDPTTSSTIQNACANPDQCPPFSITYGTPGSGVDGYYFQDTFGLGGKTLQNLTMAFATKAVYTDTGIMGIGFSLGESLEGEEQTTYRNLVEVMYDEKLIPSMSYSLYLDDLGMFLPHNVSYHKDGH